MWKTKLRSLLIGVDNILNKITKFVLVYICYMFIILCYVFLFTNLSYMELYELCINILKYFPVTFYEGQNGDDVCAIFVSRRLM